MTPEQAALGGLLDAIAGHLPAPGPGPEQDVRLACAAITGHGCDPATVAEFTTLLAAAHGPNHVDCTGHVVAAFHPGDCITCGGHVSAAGVFTPAVTP